MARSSRRRSRCRRQRRRDMLIIHSDANHLPFLRRRRRDHIRTTDAAIAVLVGDDHGAKWKRWLLLLLLHR